MAQNHFVKYYQVRPRVRRVRALVVVLGGGAVNLKNHPPLHFITAPLPPCHTTLPTLKDDASGRPLLAAIDLDSVMVVRGNEALGDVPGVFRLAVLDGAVVLRAKDEMEAELWVSKLEEMQQARIDDMVGGGSE